MTTNQHNFEAAKVTAKFKNICKTLNEVLIQGNQEEFNLIRKKLKQELTAYQQEGFISVALVGQYSSGKSTIISALTGKRDIKIDADIATDQTTSYNWNGIKTIDTPGLFTERKDHDAITYDAISKADLLVFCLTSMLFDSITIENFKKLAYEKGYRWKMMLVVNKMSDEAGEDDEKITNYCQSLAEAIKPYSLDEFPICFIDAKDYCEGVDENEDFLIEISRFETFIDALNQFVEKRRSLARLDTPVRIVLESLDDAEIAFRRDQSEDTAFFEVLKRLSRTINLERSRLRTEIRNITLDLESEITNEGAMLASALGGDFDINSLKQKAENNVSNHYEKTLNNIEMLVKEATNSLQTEIETILTGDLVQAFLQRSQIQYQISLEKNDSGIDINQIKKQVKFLLDIGEKCGLNPINLAQRDGWLNTYKGGEFGLIDVYGSELHQTVRSVGEFIGYDFAWFEAANMAKDIANIAESLGGVLGIVGVVAEISNFMQQQEYEKKLAEARQDISSQFQKIAKDLESQIEQQRLEIEKQLYQEVENKISSIREQQQQAITSSNTSMQKLSEIRYDLDKILRYINRASAS